MIGQNEMTKCNTQLVNPTLKQQLKQIIRDATSNENTHYNDSEAIESRNQLFRGLKYIGYGSAILTGIGAMYSVYNPQQSFAEWDHVRTALAKARNQIWHIGVAVLFDVGLVMFSSYMVDNKKLQDAKTFSDEYLKLKTAATTYKIGAFLTDEADIAFARVQNFANVLQGLDTNAPQLFDPKSCKTHQ